MKNTRRIAAFVAAMAMAATLALPGMMMTASAENTITVKQGDTNIAPTTMAAYQIFSGTYGGSAGQLNVTGWGSGIKGDAFLTALKADTSPVKDAFSSITYTDSAECAVAVAGAIAQYSDSSTGANFIAKTALANVTSTSTGTWDNTIKQITGVADGYYVVADTSAETGTNPTGSTYTLALLKVAGGTTVDVTTKVSLPTFDKTIADVNDSAESLAGETAGKYDKHDAWSKDADYDIGDAVPFQLTATLPSNYDKYASYKLVFHDDLQADSFTFNSSSLKVYYGEDWSAATELESSKYTISTTASANESFDEIAGKTDGTEDFTVTIANLKAAGMPSFTASTKIFVTYTATLKSTAVVGSAGNWNTGYLEYSNNPNYTGTGTEETSETPKEDVVAFTFKTEFNKIDGITQAALAGAKFKLYKMNLNAGSGAITYDTDAGTDAIATYTSKNYVLVGTEQTSTIASGASAATFGWTGLDAGNYLLVETEVPTSASGTYKKISPIAFEITAVHSSKALTSLNGITTTGEIDISGLVNDKGTANMTEGTIGGTVANTQSTTLPSTGGIGTTLFVVGGSATALAAGVYLVSKRRARNQA